MSYRNALYVALLTFPSLRAATLTVDFDPAKTQVDFVLAGVLHSVHGIFTLKSGQISFDTVSHEIGGDIIVDAWHGNSGSDARDKRMTTDILEAQRYPEIRFLPTKMLGPLVLTEVSNSNVVGNLQLHGQTHEVTVPIQITVSGTQVTAICKFIVPYVDWGMKNPSNFLLKVPDKVEIDVTAMGRLSSKTATNKVGGS